MVRVDGDASKGPAFNMVEIQDGANGMRGGCNGCWHGRKYGGRPSGRASWEWAGGVLKIDGDDSKGPAFSMVEIQDDANGGRGSSCNVFWHGGR